MDAVDDANGICFPYDVLVDILRRLPGRAIAESRCVCRSWRAIVDADNLLLPHAFPREFPGVYTTYYGFSSRTAFFARPTSRSGSRLPFVWGDWSRAVQQHCDGLLLIRDRFNFADASDVYVCNPATMRCALLPTPPTPWPCDVEGMFLAFDPAVSRHHEVFLLPAKKMLPRRWDWEETEPSGSASEFGELDSDAPKKRTVPLLVFSSRIGQWENQEFAPGHCAPGHLYDVVMTPRGSQKRTWSGEYWRGSLYVHCHSGVLMVLRCPERMYDMVQLPGISPPYDDEKDKDYTWSLPKRSVLASYERGVRYVTLHKYHLHVWALTELTNGQLEWTLAHEADLKPCDYMITSISREAKPKMEMEWEVVESEDELISLLENSSSDESEAVEDDIDQIDKDGELGELGDIYGYENSDRFTDVDESVTDNLDYEHQKDEEEQEDDEVEKVGSKDGSECSWNSDEHNFIELEDIVVNDQEFVGWGCRIIGFHPHKDVLLLHSCRIVLAYHLSTLRMQYLGYIYPRVAVQNARDIRGAFPYCPCYVDALPARKSRSS